MLHVHVIEYNKSKNHSTTFTEKPSKHWSCDSLYSVYLLLSISFIIYPCILGLDLQACPTNMFQIFQIFKWMFGVTAYMTQQLEHIYEL